MTTKEQGLERLRTLYSVLYGVPDEKVELQGWGYKGESLQCGTKACAVGWACLYPEFNEHGLRPLPEMISVDIILPEFGKHQGWLAVKRFFNLSEADALRLFSIEKYPDLRVTIGPSHKAAVLRRLRRYLLRKGAITQSRYDKLKAQEIADGIT